MPSEVVHEVVPGDGQAQEWLDNGCGWREVGAQLELKEDVGRGDGRDAIDLNLELCGGVVGIDVAKEVQVSFDDLKPQLLVQGKKGKIYDCTKSFVDWRRRVGIYFRKTDEV
jgi:hypothetical protein